jgi:hypothetical protein
MNMPKPRSLTESESKMKLEDEDEVPAKEELKKEDSLKLVNGKVEAKSYISKKRKSPTGHQRTNRMIKLFDKASTSTAPLIHQLLGFLLSPPVLPFR